MNVTLDDGRKVALHDDSTYSFVKGKARSESEEFNFTLNDGRDIILRKDGTWGILAKADGRAHLTMMTMEASATGKEPSVTQSTRTAKKLAIDKLISQVQTEVKKTKFTKNEITKCVRGFINEDKIQTEITTGTDVKVSIAFNRSEIQNIEDCLNGAYEDASTPADTGKKK
jgi:hypothetical protein